MGAIVANAPRRPARRPRARRGEEFGPHLTPPLPLTCPPTRYARRRWTWRASVPSASTWTTPCGPSGPPLHAPKRRCSTGSGRMLRPRAERWGDGQALRALGRQVLALRPGLQADLSGLRREAIRLALTQAGESPA